MNLKIGPRILIGYVAALLVFVGVEITNYTATKDLVAANERVAHSYRVKSMLSSVLLAAINAETGARGFLLTGQPRFLEPYNNAMQDVHVVLGQLRGLVDNREQAALTSDLQAMVMDRFTRLTGLIDMRRSPGWKGVDTEALDQGKRSMDRLRALILTMQTREDTQLAERTDAARRESEFAIYAIIAGAFGAAVVVIVLSIAVQRSITKPLHAFMLFAERVGAGDLTQQSQVRNADELGTLSGYLDRMVLSLKDVARQTSTVAEDVNAATSEILASTQQQAASTAEQAAAVQEANVTVTELTQSGAQISDRARQVAAAAEAVSTASMSGLQSVQNTNACLESIQEQAEAVAQNVISLSEKTQEIGQIITSVNDIAEQSHLLALNAAIQAAVAGEQGRSFSVVASEMKSLAAQSKQATVEVRAILGGIQKGINTSVMLTEEAVKRAEAGKQQADTADRTIRRLSENLEESIRAFQQIVAGSAQQQIGFEQVSQAFRNIGLAAQETAASTKQSEKAAAHLSTLSHKLKESTRRYQV